MLGAANEHAARINPAPTGVPRRRPGPAAAPAPWRPGTQAAAPAAAVPCARSWRTRPRRRRGAAAAPRRPPARPAPAASPALRQAKPGLCPAHPRGRHTAGAPGSLIAAQCQGSIAGPRRRRNPARARAGCWHGAAGVPSVVTGRGACRCGAQGSLAVLRRWAPAHLRTPQSTAAARLRPRTPRGWARRAPTCRAPRTDRQSSGWGRQGPAPGTPRTCRTAPPGAGRRSCRWKRHTCVRIRLG